MNNYRHIDRSKVQFDFVVDGYEKTYLDEEIRFLGGKVYHVEPYKKNIFRYMGQIYKIVRKNHYDIVHTNMNTLSFFSLFPAWLAGARCRILHNHSTAVRSEGLRYVMKMVLRPLAPLFANHYAACSRLAGAWMYGESKLEQGNVTIVANAVDLREYAYSEKLREKYRKDLGLSNETFVVGHVGRFAYQKNHPFLLKVFREIVRQHADSALLLIGDGELRAAIEECADSYGLRDKVHFLGLRDDVKSLYSSMDAFVLPSWFEGLPVVSVEAQANGLPCFFSDKVTPESRLSPFATFLSLEDSPQEWAERILQARGQRNGNALQDLQDAGFDIEKQAAVLADWYMRIGTA